MINGIEQLNKAVEILKADGVVGMPTETVYGLAGNVYSEKAVKLIFETKRRPSFDPLIVHISHLSQILGLVKEFTELPQFIAETFWPGPLTMVLPKSRKVSSLVTSGLEEVGIRFPKHPLAQKLISMAGAPLAAPSANRFGKTSPTSASHVHAELPNVFVIDGGDCEVGLESTVIGFDSNYQKVKIYRPGIITQKDLQFKLRSFGRFVEVVYEQSKVAPGHLKHHYMPDKPFVIFNSSQSPSHLEIKEKLKLQAEPQGEELILSENPIIAARELYGNLRKSASVDNKNFIYFHKNEIHQEEEWLAIMDRLQKAATFIFE